MLIINETRKEQINEFIDEDHQGIDRFYDLLEQNITPSKMQKEMQLLIDKYPDFYDPYLVIADILADTGKKRENAQILEKAYKHAIMRIADCNGRWPKEMRWGFLENRHLMRTIEYFATLCWDTGFTATALDIYRRLLRCNTNDNQGARHSILAIRLGLTKQEWQKPLESIHNGQVIGLDAFKVSKIFNKNAKRFPEEFQWWFELHEGDEE